MRSTRFVIHLTFLRYLSLKLFLNETRMLAQKIIDTASSYIPLEDFDSTASANTSFDDIDAVAKTINAVRILCSSQAQKQLKLDVSSFIIILDSDSKRTIDEGSSLGLVREIAESARAAAPAHACSSVLAGHASESDEYADVGLLLSAGSAEINPEDRVEKKARAVLSSLGLDSLHSTKIIPLPLSSETRAPVAFKASAQDADVQHLSSLLAKLSRSFAFSVSAEDVVLHFLLGQLPESGAWAGLLGVGIWSDS
ncbi:hypothetical protein ACEPAG_1020 [Sanghuangporus baumii]